MALNRPDITPPTVSRRWGTLTKQIVVIGSLVGMVWLVSRISPIIPIAVLAVMLAYILTPVVNGLHRLTRIPRILVLILVYLLLLVVAGLTPALVIPSLVKQFNELNLDLQRVIIETYESLSRQQFEILGYAFQLPDFYNEIVIAFRNLLSPFATGAVSVVVGIASSFVWLLFILVISFYLVKDSAKIGHYLRKLPPPDYREEFEELGRRVGLVWNAFFRGQIILGLAVGVTTGIVVSALGLRNGLVLGFLAGILEIIPYFGPILAAIPAVLLALFQGSTWLPVSNLWFAVIIIAAYIIIQQVENYYLVPRIIGHSVRLHPVVVLLGAVAGATFAGILGVFLAAPVIATLRVLANYSYRKLMDLEPFGESFRPAIDRTVIYGGMIGGHDIEAILFDLDGTLVDTDEKVVERLATRLEGIEPLLPSRDAKKTARRTIMATEKPANALMSIIDKVKLGDRSRAVKERLGQLQGQQRADKFKLVDEVPELLNYLDGRFKLGIVSTRSREEVESFLEQFGYQDQFQVIVSREDVTHQKPAPDSVLLAAEKLGLPVQRCALVGDTKADIEAANLAGAVSLAVLSGLGDRDDLAEAQLILDRISDLREWL